MGIGINLAVLLGEIAERHRLGGRVATLGEQSLSFDPDRMAFAPPTRHIADGAGISAATRLFLHFGFAGVESVDIDAAVGATHLFDLNLADTPDTLAEKFDLVFNGGTLEHVFHLPNALANVSRMLREGGVVIHVLPCNNWADHGFYQFSPCLMFDYYRAAGFECLESMLLGYALEQEDCWLVRCAVPGLLGSGLSGVLDEGIYLHLFAARRRPGITLYPSPIQAPYGGAADVSAATNRPRWFLPFVLSGGRRQELLPQAELLLPAAGIAPEIGYAWTARLAEFAAISDTTQRPARSPLILLEDGVPLGPPHAAHAEIRSRGRGRYSHWGETLYFAASDNTPPVANGRRYEVVIPGTSVPDGVPGLRS
jgi:SAM-dependent methyltransferase